MLLASKIDPRSKAIELEDTTVTGTDYLELEFERTDNATSSEDASTSEFSGSFMSAIFAVSRQTTRKAEVEQYLGMEVIGLFDNPLGW